MNLSGIITVAMANLKEKKKVQEAEVYFSYMLSSGSGFAARTDNGEQAFIPASVLKASKLQEGDIANARLIPNTHPNNAQTPWVVIYAKAGVLPPLAGGAPAETLDDRALRAVGEFGFASTAEIASEVGADVSLTHNALLRLFKRKAVVKADVFSDPAQERASFCLWAKDLSAFMGEDE